MLKKLLSNWRFLWPVQLLVMLLNSLAATLLPLLFPAVVTPLRVVFLWVLPSVLGALTACRLARVGLTAYAAWLLPPIIHSAVPWLLIGYPPAPGSMLLCAFVSLVGAAAGDVLRRGDLS